MTWGDSHYGTYAFGQRWSDWPGTDDWEPDDHEPVPDAHPYPDAAELEALLELAEDHRNESRNP